MARIDSGCQFAVVGAGPYGLAVASHLRDRGCEVRILGKVMDFWHSQMPKGMKLRSPLAGSNISDPRRALTLEKFSAAENRPLEKALPLEHFVQYGQWFKRRELPDLDPRNVAEVNRHGNGYRLLLEDGETLHAERLVVATGIGSFGHYPTVFAPLPRELASHTSDRANRDLGRFAGRRVVVIGSGQSALESAALLHESGAEVEVVARQPRLRFLRSNATLERLQDYSPFPAPGKIGPMGLNWLIEQPSLFTLLPRHWQVRLTRRAIRSAGSGWLKPRVEPVAFRLGTEVVGATAVSGKVHLQLSDGTRREADHVLLGTGYKIDIARYPFLTPDLLDTVNRVDGYPVLDRGFESSAPGLYFVGTTAAHSFGPLCRFVAGTGFTAHRLASRIRNRVPGSKSRKLPAQLASRG